VALSYLRRPSSRAERLQVPLDEAATRLRVARTAEGSPERIESGIIVREMMACLNDEERRLVRLKLAGYSSRQIAGFTGTSANAVDITLWRARKKLRDFAAPGHDGATRDPLTAPSSPAQPPAPSRRR